MTNSPPGTLPVSHWTQWTHWFGLTLVATTRGLLYSFLTLFVLPAVTGLRDGIAVIPPTWQFLVFYVSGWIVVSVAFPAIVTVLQGIAFPQRPAHWVLYTIVGKIIHDAVLGLGFVAWLLFEFEAAHRTAFSPGQWIVLLLAAILAGLAFGGVSTFSLRTVVRSTLPWIMASVISTVCWVVLFGVTTPVDQSQFTVREGLLLGMTVVVTAAISATGIVLCQPFESATPPAMTDQL